MNKIAEQTLITLIDQLRDTHLLSKEEWMFLIENRTRDVSEYLFSQHAKSGTNIMDMMCISAV